MFQMLNGMNLPTNRIKGRSSNIELKNKNKGSKIEELEMSKEEKKRNRKKKP